jgi:nucleoside phosphorylase
MNSMEVTSINLKGEIAARPERRRADLAILVALPSPELKQVLDVFSDSWRQEGQEGVVFEVGSLDLGGEKLHVVAALQNDVGMVPASILATKTVNVWQPRFLAMVGICAGRLGQVQLGDIVVGQQMFDYGSGKLLEGRLHPDYNPVSIDEGLCSLAKAFARDDAVAAEIRQQWPLPDSGRPPTELNVHVGAMGSGAAVVSDDSVVEDIEKNKRSLLAVDMEAYGFARAAASAIVPPRFIVVKGVQDFADAEKADTYREYAAFVSARWLHRFVTQYWDDIAS